MKNHGSITTMDAFRELGITRLSARISDLKSMGIGIVTVTETNDNARYARYSLKEKEQPDPFNHGCPLG